MNPTPERTMRADDTGAGFDPVALSWCAREIRASLAAAGRALREALKSAITDRAPAPEPVEVAAATRSGDHGGVIEFEPVALPRAPVSLAFAYGEQTAALLKDARRAQRQAWGALRLIDVPGATQLAFEIGTAIERFQGGYEKIESRPIEAAVRAGEALGEYLDELAHGEPVQPLRLYPYWRALLEARRAERVHPADLFFPDLALQTPDGTASALRLTPDVRAAARGRFERGLLTFLRKPDDDYALSEMRAAAETLEAATRDTPQRRFWWLTLAFFDALRTRSIVPDLYGKRLIAKLNTQMKHALDHGAPAPRQLLADTLFELARARNPSGVAAQAVSLFGLAGIVPSDFELPRYASVDAGALREARDATVAAKQAWDKAARGSRADATGFADACAALAQACQRLPAPGLQRVAGVLSRTRSVVEAAGRRIPEAASIEIATAITFVEQALERGARADDPYHSHGSEIAERLSAAFAGKPVPDALPSWMLQLAAAAQDRLTMATLCAELHVNLRSAEKPLDAFFRDPALRAPLPGAAEPIRKVAGALELTGHPMAAAGARATADAVAATATRAEPPDEAACEHVAANFGALGFYVDALSQPDRLAGQFVFDEATGAFRLASDRAREAAAEDARRAAESLLAEASAIALPSLDGTESDMSFLELPRLGESPQASPASDTPSPFFDPTAFNPDLFAAPMPSASAPPTPAATRPAPPPAGVSSVFDATAFDAAAFETLPAIEIDALDLDPAGEDTPPAAVDPVDAASPVGAGSPVAAAPAAIASHDSEVDTELLEVFLGEAGEVFETIAESSATLRREPSAPEALAALRRGFHTLKGSSRMVGLREFGEAGWAMEQVLNRWLDESVPATADLLALVARAQAEMQGWVRGLQADPAFRVVPQAMIDAAHALLGQGGQAAVDAPDDFALESATSLQDDLAEPEFDVGAFDPPSVDAGSGDADGSEADVGDASTAWSPRGSGAEPMDAMPATTADEALPVEGAPASGFGASADTTSALAHPPADAAPTHAGATGGARGTPLYSIFLGEADDLLARLGEQVEAWRVEPAQHASERAARAAHSLAGSSSLMGLSGVNALAVALENFLRARSALADGVLAVDSPALEAYVFAVERLRAMLHRFAAGQPAGDVADALARLASIESRLPMAASDVEASLAAFASPAPHEAPAEPLPELADELDAELLPVFLVEADDFMPAIAERLRQWSQHPADPSLPAALMRDLHTVKGSARMAGAMRLGQLVHEIETRIEGASHRSAATPALIDELIADHDRVLALYDLLRQPGAVEASVAAAAAAASATAATTTDAVEEGTGARADVDPGTPAHAQAQAPWTAPAPAPSAPSWSAAVPAPVSAAFHAPAPAPALSQASETVVRVRADLLDRMVNEAGEVSIARARLDNEIGMIRQSLSELTENVARLRSQLREIEIQGESSIQARIAQSRDAHGEFDPLEMDRYTRHQELTRMLAESVNDVATVQQNMGRALDEATADLNRQAQVARDLQQNLMRVRMVQFGTIAERLYRVVRRSAKDTERRVNLEVRGGNAEIDRGILERMAGPIEHLLRNAVAHGIEPREARVAAGKAEAGEIVVELRQERNEAVLVLADDGGGLDLARIRERGVRNGLIEADQAVSDADLAKLIFLPGFTTADSVTATAGRGVGMDVVAAEVSALGGRIETDTQPGRGTRFTIHLPLTMAVTQVVLLTVGERRFAVPAVLVEQLMQMKPPQLAAAYAERSIEWQGGRLPLYHLSGLLDLPEQAPVAQRQAPVLVLHSGNQRIALHVDHISANQEVVVKNVGPQLMRLQGVVGATVLGNGEIVLIVNPVQLAQRDATGAEGLDLSRSGMRLEAIEAATQLPPTVLVVDDSLTVRKATQRLLSRENYQVVLAKDGVDALRQMQDVVPDVMLVDIEMPRMDGFDLTRNVRADARLRDIPIVMITSRTADKHRNKAMALGVDVYLGKPYAEDELLGHVARFIAARREATEKT